jgi:hypothetical protein
VVVDVVVGGSVVVDVEVVGGGSVVVDGSSSAGALLSSWTWSSSGAGTWSSTAPSMWCRDLGAGTAPGAVKRNQRVPAST